jgi:hypothetical protein
MKIGWVSTLLMAPLIQQSLYLRAVAVDNSLAEIRACWRGWAIFAML